MVTGVLVVNIHKAASNVHRTISGMPLSPKRTWTVWYSTYSTREMPKNTRISSVQSRAPPRDRTWTLRVCGIGIKSFPLQQTRTHDTIHGVKHSYKKSLKKDQKKDQNSKEKTPLNITECVQLGFSGRSMS